MRTATITLEALTRCHGLTTGELLQLEAWVAKYPDLLEAAPGQLYLEPAMVAIKHVRGGWLPDLRLPAMPSIRAR